MWIGGTGINEGQKRSIQTIHGRGLWVYSVRNRPIGVLNGPIVLNIHIGPNSPPMAGIWAFDGGPHSGRHSNLRSL